MTGVQTCALPISNGMELFSFLQVDSDLTAWFILDGQEYEMSHFDINFAQSVDHKGQPQDEVRGGIMSITLSQTLPENIYRWGMTSIPKNGSVIFKSKTTNPPLKINFINAYCIRFNRSIANEGGLESQLVISPDEMLDRKSTRLNSSHPLSSRMPSSA